ncbi:SpoIVB peptidase S55 domain-containing protein [Aminivibrio sp.]|uniref:SpoIVB peptidase S55 domain-containing protein n=1 Tax=Aminivibrio sp. TaxID=1872489 RepID=UPI0025BCABB2|nr:SpoIVB peptidase S55 domain-containing protein [Aminivibrio sp.]
MPFGPTLGATSLRPGMKGYALTVVSGREIVPFPVEIVSVIPKKGSPKNLIMIRASGPIIAKTGGIAAGMSGSPVYVNGKLIGAIGYGWNFSEHNLGLVTPLEDMASVWDWPEKKVTLPGLPSQGAGPDEEDNKEEESENAHNGTSGKDTSGKDEREEDEVPLPKGEVSPLFIDGISSRKATEITALLGKERYVPGGGFAEDIPVEMNAGLLPGEAISVLLAWGDVTIGSTGTLTAVAPDGRFIGFAHPFLGKGAVNFPVARAYIHSVVPSLEAPFKVGSPLRIVGTVTHDRPQAIGGRIGYFTPSVSATLNFQDTDRNAGAKKRFHFVPDPFMGAKLSTGIFTGLIDDLWGRKGQGTAVLSLTVHGRGMGQGWTRKNMFFSDKDLAADALKEAADLLDIIFLNPFAEVYPFGVTVSAEFTEEPRLMFIEGIEVKGDSFSAGDTVEVEVNLRPYRKKQVKKIFKIVIPKDAGGFCEILVRGGGIEPLHQSAVVQGWKTIANFRQMFTEMSALETNNELIIEFNYEKIAKRGKERKDTEDPVSKEEQELLSEMKKRRLEDGTLQIFKSEFVVEGLLRKIVNVKPGDGKNSEQPDKEDG